MRTARWLCLAALLVQLGCSTEPQGTRAFDADGDGVLDSHDCEASNPATWRTVGIYRDEDGDGVGTGDLVVACVGDLLPTGWAPIPGDCAPLDPLHFRHLTLIMVDRDGDGFTVPEAADLCLGAEDPPGWLLASGHTDCDDGDAARDRWAVLYPDADGDGLGVGPRTIDCIGAVRPAGLARAGLDGDDADPAVGRTFDDDDLQRLLD